MELENIVANTVYIKAREGTVATHTHAYTHKHTYYTCVDMFVTLYIYIPYNNLLY